MDEVDEEEWIDSITFVGCNCPHDSEEHGWGCCNVEGCKCEGGWEE